VYGVVGASARRVELRTSGGAGSLELGPGGTFLAAVRGYPEDQALEVAITDERGRVTVRSLGRQPSLVADLGGAPAWRLQLLTLGTRARCGQLLDARRMEGGVVVREVERDGFPGSSTPTACVDPRTKVKVVADARRFKPGQRGVPGFDRWNWRDRPPRTVVWGVAQTPRTVRALRLRGAPGGPRAVPVSPGGTFGVVLPFEVTPGRVRLDATLADGSIRTVVPGRDLVPDSVAARRPR
jgi:hypothetical protein